MRWGLGLVLLAGCDRVFLIEPLSIDSLVDGGDVTLCGGGMHGGNGGLLGVCLDATPGAVLSADTAIDTGLRGENGDCMQIVTQSDRSEVCVLAANRIEITATVRARGQRPLVLFALDDLIVSSGGEIDVGGRRQLAPSAGSDHEACAMSGIHGAARTSGGGGGAGGTFASLGGMGGTGSSGSGSPGMGGTPADVVGVGSVHGGCRGGRGGDGSDGTTSCELPAGVVYGGAGGLSGGAVYLIAGRSITVGGTINASGGGGFPGMCSAMGGGGGGGGGSGGLIGLDAPAIIIESTAIVVANGGGGAGGGGAASDGEGGLNGVVGEFPFEASGGLGGQSGGAAGGAGGTASSSAGTPGGSATSGGGGGGGVGHVMWFATQSEIQSGARISPVPTPP